ncbi:MAG: hypothetical protein E2P02_15080 [Acidobacteria bacterium]|nr:MAG: hypothetical protein E2P02_15080 [Acidobacteriota bacterium]
MTREVYARYLTNVWHYAVHSAVVIGMAGARCVPENPKLGDYLLKHAREELGHDLWALQDLKALGIDEQAVRATRPVPACASMIGIEYYWAAHANPVGLFGWMYILEAMGDDLGSESARRIKDGLKLPEGVKFLAGHGDADEGHAADLTREITENVKPADMDDVHHVADVVADLYVRIFQQIGEAEAG